MAEELRVESTLEIEESGTEQYPSLKDAQRAALPHLAELVASIVRQWIEEGRFVVVGGVVRLAQRCESEEMADRGFTNGENDV